MELPAASSVAVVLVAVRLGGVAEGMSTWGAVAIFLALALTGRLTRPPAFPGHPAVAGIWLPRLAAPRLVPVVLGAAHPTTTVLLWGAMLSYPHPVAVQPLRLPDPLMPMGHGAGGVVAGAVGFKT